MLQIGLINIVRAVGLEPDGILGHSNGEVACAYADGCFNEEQAITVAYARSIIGDKSRELIGIGKMAAVGELNEDALVILHVEWQDQYLKKKSNFLCYTRRYLFSREYYAIRFNMTMSYVITINTNISSSALIQTLKFFSLNQLVASLFNVCDRDLPRISIPRRFQCLLLVLLFATLLVHPTPFLAVFPCCVFIQSF